MGKGEIARYEQFFLFQHCFQKACFPGVSKGLSLCGNGLNSLGPVCGKGLTLYQTKFWTRPNGIYRQEMRHIYFTSIEKQVLTTYTNFSRFCFLGTTPVLASNVWAKDKSQS